MRIFVLFSLVYIATAVAHQEQQSLLATYQEHQIDHLLENLGDLYAQEIIEPARGQTTVLQRFDKYTEYENHIKAFQAQARELSRYWVDKSPSVRRTNAMFKLSTALHAWDFYSLCLLFLRSPQQGTSDILVTLRKIDRKETLNSGDMQSMILLQEALQHKILTIDNFYGLYYASKGIDLKSLMESFAQRNQAFTELKKELIRTKLNPPFISTQSGLKMINFSLWFISCESYAAEALAYIESMKDKPDLYIILDSWRALDLTGPEPQLGPQGYVYINPAIRPHMDDVLFPNHNNESLIVPNDTASRGALHYHGDALGKKPLTLTYPYRSDLFDVFLAA